ncbi:hypothetical protein EBAPG3_013045 [Nitrosospira lacus]|uniref:Calcium-dependent cell adhesion molecule N-terminal domain-containing protein n=1 Tax=Nitrosospira lacus TaxID=1288494 RepID=A0A1W6SS60_9PROT|nr:beta/gamma crystallin domain-containing protein [Nitrosospira lacus]ARO88619.1 hypothetical protein EBAPG3_013045 [Nitrosospira lacus]
MDILVANFRRTLVAAVMMFGGFVLTGVAHAQQSTTGKKDGKVIVEVPIIVMVPVQVSSDLIKDKGCWVKLYDKKDYKGDSLLLVGPVNLAQMMGPFGFNWENKIRSLETGPRANVTIYDNRNFRDQDKFVDPNAKIPDMSKKMGFFDDIRSMMLSCI